MKKNGYTLIELMIVVVAFSVIALIASETIIVTVRSAYKADAVTKVRQNIDYAFDSMERQIRGAKSITSACDGTSYQSITILDQNSNPVTFSCNNINSNGAVSSIASSSASLTSNISISFCSFVCTKGTGSTPTSVTMSVTATDTKNQNAPITATSQVTIRSY